MSSSTSAIMTEQSIPINSPSNLTNEIRSPYTNPRSCILQVGMSAGRLCGVANSHMEASTTSQTDQTLSSDALVMAMADLLRDLFKTSISLKLHLTQSIYNKLELNNRKYPVELCKGKAGKYTQYTQTTGITADSQTTKTAMGAMKYTDFLQQVPELIETIQDFAEARVWTKFHTPRNIVLALLGEVGELAELVQWKGDGDVNDSENGDECRKLDFSEKELDKLSQELADVSIYLLRLVSITNTTTVFVQRLENFCNKNFQNNQHTIHLT